MKATRGRIRVLEPIKLHKLYIEEGKSITNLRNRLFNEGVRSPWSRTGHFCYVALYNALNQIPSFKKTNTNHGARKAAARLNSVISKV